jgi:hypothetical protein
MTWARLVTAHSAIRARLYVIYETGLRAFRNSRFNITVQPVDGHP